MELIIIVVVGLLAFGIWRIFFKDDKVAWAKKILKENPNLEEGLRAMDNVAGIHLVNMRWKGMWILYHETVSYEHTRVDEKRDRRYHQEAIVEKQKGGTYWDKETLEKRIDKELKENTLGYDKKEFIDEVIHTINNFNLNEESDNYIEEENRTIMLSRNNFWETKYGKEVLDIILNNKELLQKLKDYRMHKTNLTYYPNLIDIKAGKEVCPICGNMEKGHIVDNCDLIN